MGDHHKAAFEKAKRDVALFAVLKPVVLKRETRPGEHSVRIVEAEAVLREVISVLPLKPAPRLSTYRPHDPLSVVAG